MFTTNTPNDITDLPIIVTHATGPGLRQDRVVLVEVLSIYTLPYTGPEVYGIFDTPHNGQRKLTLPLSVVEVYTLHDESALDYDRMPW